MPAPSLYNLAKKACIRNISAITDVGDIPYDLVRPILLKLENPEQLMELEQNSPHLVGATAELWRDFIRRDVPAYAAPGDPLPEPRDPHRWARLYRKLRREADAAVRRDAEALEAAMHGLQQAAAARTSRVVDARSVPKVPRERGMRVERTAPPANGPGSVGGPKITVRDGGRVRKVTGHAMLEKVRKQARAFQSLAAPPPPPRPAAGVPARPAVHVPKKASASAPAPPSKENAPVAPASVGKSRDDSETDRRDAEADEKLRAPVAYRIPKPNLAPGSRPQSPRPEKAAAADAPRPAMTIKRKPPDSIFMPRKR